MINNGFLPLNKKEALAYGWEQVDFVVVTGDAYVDHPSFGSSIIARLLEADGFKVGIISQPNWRKPSSFQEYGEPRLGFLVGSGNIDSMVNHYTAAKKPRSNDAYSPGGKKGLRPDRAAIVYSQKIKELYPHIPVILGGVESSLRRFAHYDYWSDEVMPSILVDSKGDMLTYGMSEIQIRYIAKGLDKGWPVHKMQNVGGTAFLTDQLPTKGDYQLIASYEEVKNDKRKYAQAFQTESEEQNPFLGKTLVQPHGNQYLVVNPPAKPLTQKEMDHLYHLPFTRTYHPSYNEAGGIPALAEVEFSVTDHRGCFGGCSFCAITFHQGRIIQNRSEQSVLSEIKTMTELPNFKGYIHDLGGPTANFRIPACKKQLTHGACKHRQCLYPEPCPNLEVDHKEYIDILRKARKMDKVKKVFIRSGIRFDYMLQDKNNAFFEEMCKHHISGLLKVAPEHVAPNALHAMGKPQRHVYDKFVKKYKDYNEKQGKEQYLVPYFLSSHPGCTLKDAVLLAEYIRDMGYNPEQVQDFIPTPGSLATAMYYTELDPRTMKDVYIPRSSQEKAWQRALMQYRNPKNYDLVYEALVKAGRKDLIGFDAKALIRPYSPKKQQEQSVRKGDKASSAKTSSGKAPAGKGQGKKNTRPNKGNSAGKGSKIVDTKPRGKGRDTAKSSKGKRRK